MSDWQTKLDTAAQIAFNAHRGQFRKGRKSTKPTGVNYFVHPAQVAAILYEWGFEPSKMPDLFCAAWLHDAAEDFPLDLGGPPLILDEISRRLGSLVNGYVHELTCFPGDDEVTYKASWSPDLVPRKSIVSLIVKAADQICNLRDFRITSWNYVAKYAAKASPIFEAIALRHREASTYAGFDIYPSVAGALMLMRITPEKQA